MLLPHIRARFPVARRIMDATLRASARLCGSSIELMNAVTLAVVGCVLFSAISGRLNMRGAEQAVAGIAKTGDDVLLVVEALVDGGGID
jgi:hypothetical protein